MAEFNPNVPSPEPKNFAGYSKEPDKDRTWSTLFGGAAATLEGAVQGADQMVQQDIRKEATEKVDQVRRLFGVDAVTDASSSGVPSEIAQGRAYAEKLKTAYNAGTIRESYYYGQLQSKVKELRSRFPGYEEQVDNIIQDITGVTPANAIVAALRREAAEDKEGVDANERMYQQWTQTNQAEIATLFPDYFENPDKYPRELVRSRVARLQADREQVTADSNEITLLDKQGNLTKDNVIESATNEVQLHTSNFLEGAWNAVGTSYPDIQKKLNSLSRQGAEADPKAMQEVLGQLRELRSGLVQNVHKNVLGKRLNEKGETYGKFIQGADRENLLKTATAPIDDLIESITNEDYGLAGVNAAIVKTSQSKTGRQMLEEHDIFRKFSAAREILGPEMANTILSAGDGTALSEMSKALQTMAISEAVIGNGASAADAVTKINASGERNPETYKSTINEIKSWITDPTKAMVLDDKAVDFLFGPNNQQFLSAFKKEEQVGIYNTLVNGQVSKAIKNSGNDRNWQQYTNWAYTNFVSLFKQEVDTIQINQGQRPFLDVQWNPEAGQFVYKIDPKINAYNVFDIASAAERSDTEVVTRALNRVNVALSSVKTVMDQDGADLTTQMDVLMKGALAFDPKRIGEGTILDQLKGAVRKGLDALKPGDGEKTKTGKDASRIEPEVLSPSPDERRNRQPNPNQGEALTPGKNDEPVSDNKTLYDPELQEMFDATNRLTAETEASGLGSPKPENFGTIKTQAMDIAQSIIEKFNAGDKQTKRELTNVINPDGTLDIEGKKVIYYAAMAALVDGYAEETDDPRMIRLRDDLANTPKLNERYLLSQ
jgi:hypothetical protein